MVSQLLSTMLASCAVLFLLLVGGWLVHTSYRRFAQRNPRMGPFRGEGAGCCGANHGRHGNYGSASMVGAVTCQDSSLTRACVTCCRDDQDQCVIQVHTAHIEATALKMDATLPN